MSSAIAFASSYEVAVPWSGARSPARASSAPNSPRSSARWIDSGEVPTIGMPAALSRRASPSGVCPPSWTMTPTTPGPPAARPEPSSAWKTSSTSSNVSGSK